MTVELILWPLGLGVVVAFFCLTLVVDRINALQASNNVLFAESLKLRDDLVELRRQVDDLEERLDYGRRVEVE
jgi:hypothetical protein